VRPELSQRGFEANFIAYRAGRPQSAVLSLEGLLSGPTPKPSRFSRAIEGMRSFLRIRNTPNLFDPQKSGCVSTMIWYPCSKLNNLVLVVTIERRGGLVIPRGEDLLVTLTRSLAATSQKVIAMIEMTMISISFRERQVLQWVVGHANDFSWV